MGVLSVSNVARMKRRFMLGTPLDGTIVVMKTYYRYG
jgi:hypothetical protein